MRRIGGGLGHEQLVGPSPLGHEPPEQPPLVVDDERLVDLDGHLPTIIRPAAKDRLLDPFVMDEQPLRLDSMMHPLEPVRPSASLGIQLELDVAGPGRRAWIELERLDRYSLPRMSSYDSTAIAEHDRPIRSAQRCELQAPRLVANGASFETIDLRGMGRGPDLI